jgi:hypothetical protein
LSADGARSGAVRFASQAPLTAKQKEESRVAG